MTTAQIATALGGALALGAAGCKCFPCLANKHPATPHGFKEAANDPDKLRDLWRRHPGPLVAVATGEASDIDVLDSDGKHPEAGEWWAENRHRLPRTRAHRTRSGGLHLVFQHSPGLRCWAGRSVPGVDGRGDGASRSGGPPPVFQCDPMRRWPVGLHGSLLIFSSCGWRHTPKSRSRSRMTTRSPAWSARSRARLRARGTR
jgi:hypothetical protein